MKHLCTLLASSASSLALALALQACSDSDVTGPPDPPPPGPTAEFQAAATQGTAPVTVPFVDLSSGATSWLWEFGDGAVSSEQSPVHQYAAAGDYSVRLTVGGPTGTDAEEKPDLIHAIAAFEDPGFELSTAGVEPGGAWVPFTGALGGASGHVVRSLAPPAASTSDNGMPSAGVQWLELSAESTSDAQPPSNPSAITGTAPAVGGAGVSQEIRYSATHTVLQLEAAFVNAEGFASLTNDWMSIDVSDGVATHNLYYRDTFSGVIGPSLIHPADVTPVETVTADLAELFPDSDETTLLALTAQVGNGGDALVPSRGYVDDLRLAAPPPAPVAVEFMVSQRIGGIGTPFEFIDESSGEPKSWIWDFGDGTASSEQEPGHVYSGEGSFDVRLHATSPGSSDALTKDDFIVVDNSACEISAIQVQGGTCRGTGVPVTFENDATNADSYTWDFGDGTAPLETASADDVVHAFASPGNYVVSLTVHGACFGAVEPPPAQTVDSLTMDIVDPPSLGAVSFTIAVPGTDVSCIPPGFGEDEAAFKNENVVFAATNSDPIDAPITSFTWEVVGVGVFGNDPQETTSFSTEGVRTIRLTAANCAGSVQVTKTIKIVQDWDTVYSFLDGGDCASCHQPGGASNNVLILNTQGTAYDQLHSAMVNSCAGSPALRIDSDCSGGSNSSNSGVVWALSNNVCGNGVMSTLCGCMSPTTEAAKVNQLRDWIDFGSPEN